jgi:beta-phosphoglucomutase-like phosphatase (HAD superfamily)
VLSPICAVIFDVDGVLVDSPHEQSWREALEELMAGPWRATAAATAWSPGALDHDVYQVNVAGKSRVDGARAILAVFRIPDPDGTRALAYATAKQARVMELIERGEFRAFDDALRFLVAVRARGVRVAAASSSRNATLLLRRIRMPGPKGGLLADALDADLSGKPVRHGKPDPAIFLAAAAALGADPHVCLVVEDAAVGIRAAITGRMRALGVARDGDAAALRASGADYVVETLDEVDVDSLLGTG